MDNWQRTFVEKLGKARSSWVRGFEETLDQFVTPAFEDMGNFLRDHGFRVSTPLNDDGRRSFKFELAENAYVLCIFRFTGVGEFEFRAECFVPGMEPQLEKTAMRLSDVDEDWTRAQFQAQLDRFVDFCAGAKRQKFEAVAVA